MAYFPQISDWRLWPVSSLMTDGEVTYEVSLSITAGNLGKSRWRDRDTLDGYVVHYLISPVYARPGLGNETPIIIGYTAMLSRGSWFKEWQFIGSRGTVVRRARVYETPGMARSAAHKHYNGFVINSRRSGRAMATA